MIQARLLLMTEPSVYLGRPTQPLRLARQSKTIGRLGLLSQPTSSYDQLDNLLDLAQFPLPRDWSVPANEGPVDEG